MATNIFGGNSPGIGSQTFSDIGAGVSDIFASFGAEAKQSFDIAEQQQYQSAADLALQNEQFTKMSTAIQEAQIGREVTQSLGRTTAQVAGAGFAASGSALDILRSSAQQGALAKAVAGEQGLITEAGYAQQAQSYTAMAAAAGKAASAEGLAQIGDYIGAGLQTIAAIATI